MLRRIIDIRFMDNPVKLSDRNRLLDVNALMDPRGVLFDHLSVAKMREIWVVHLSSCLAKKVKESTGCLRNDRGVIKASA